MTKSRAPFFVELTRTRELRRRKDREIDATTEVEVWQWRWRKVAPNGRILAVSGEGYFNRADCLKGLERATPGYAFATSAPPVDFAGWWLLNAYLPPGHPAYAIEVREIS